MAQLQPQDHGQRQLALDPHSSFICEAPAGSGKTELLTQRVLVLLTTVEKPESVLAITFTRKAAAEMQERVMQALKLACGPEPRDEHKKATWRLALQVLEIDRSKNWDLLNNPKRLNISTFDSLCAWLSKTLPLQAATGLDLLPAQKPELLYQQAAEKLLEELAEQSAWAEPLTHLLMHLDVRVPLLKNLFVSLLATRDSWLPLFYSRAQLDTQSLKEILEEHLHSVINEKLETLQQSLASYADQIFDLAGFAAAQCRRLNIDSPLLALEGVDLERGWPSCDASGIEQWQALKLLLLTKNGTWRSKLDKNGGFPADGSKVEKAAFKDKKAQAMALIGELKQREELLLLFNELDFLPSAGYSKLQWQTLESLLAILPALLAYLQLVFKQTGELDFSEIALRARQALGDPDEPTDLNLRLDHRLQHILVDEFQDTSFNQIQLIERLTAGWEEGDGRSLFCVGDAMQSIYSFRGANVGLFLNAQAQGIGEVNLSKIKLSANFRSQAGIVDWVNQTFAQAFPRQADITSGAVTFSLAEAFKSPEEGEAVETWLFDKEASDVDVQQAQSIVEKIQGILAQEKQSSIAVLVRSRAHASYIVQELNQQRCAFKAVDLEPLQERPEIQDLFNLTLALLFLEKRIEWLAVLRAPWCGINLDDLEIIAQGPSASGKKEIVFYQLQACLASQQGLDAEQKAGQQQELFTMQEPHADSSGPQLSENGRTRLARILPILECALAQSQRKSLRHWVEGTWLELGGASCLEEDVAFDNVERYFQFLETLSELHYLPSEETLREELAKLFASPNPQADGRLQIMTIHKSKGLEFDWVFLPNLQKQPRNNEESLLLWQERLSRSGQEQILFGPISAYAEEKDPIYRYLEFERKKRETLEACRLLYVACTRAKRRLVLSATVKRSKKDELRFEPPSSSTLLSFIWPSVALAAQDKSHPSRVEVDESLLGGEKLEAGSQIKNELASLKRLALEFGRQDLVIESALDQYFPFADYDNSEEDMSLMQLGDDHQRLFGTVIHKILQYFVQASRQESGSLMGDPVAAIRKALTDEKHRKNWAIQLQNAGIMSSRLDHALSRLESLLSSIIDCQHFKWISSAPSLYCEFPVSIIEGGELKQLVFDVLLIDDKQQAWVLDYKTAELQDGQDKQSFIDQEREQYRDVMMRYRSAAQGLGYESVRCALYLLSTGDLVEYN